MQFGLRCNTISAIIIVLGSLISVPGVPVSVSRVGEGAVI